MRQPLQPPCDLRAIPIDADQLVSPGEHTVAIEVERLPERRATLRLIVDGELQAEAELSRLLGMLSSTGMNLGRAIAPINHDYNPPFKYPGTIKRVIFELPSRPTDKDKREEAEREARAAMTRQ
jgi:arylsulfatase